MFVEALSAYGADSILWCIPKPQRKTAEEEEESDLLPARRVYQNEYIKTSETHFWRKELHVDLMCGFVLKAFFDHLTPISLGAPLCFVPYKDNGQLDKSTSEAKTSLTTASGFLWNSEPLNDAGDSSCSTGFGWEDIKWFSFRVIPNAYSIEAWGLPPLVCPKITANQGGAGLRTIASRITSSELAAMIFQ